MIYQQIEYICKEGQNEYKPQFCIFGFQYVKVETDINIDDIKFTAQAVYSDMDETGSFVCGNEDVNKLVKNSIWSMKGNFADIPTDCPTRERQGWTGDAAAFVNTGMYLMDCYPVFRKWLNEVRANQLEDGKIPGVAPNSEPDGFFKKLSNGSAGWADAITIVPNALCRVYNCTDIVKENYGAMKKWVDFSEKRARKSRIKSKLKVDKNKKYIVDTGFHWGEWLEPDVNSKDALKQTLMKGSPEVPTAYFAYSAYLLSVAAKKTGNNSDSKYYLNLSEKIKKAYRAYFVKDGKINSNRQASYVRPIALDILSQSEKQTASNDLNELVKNNNYHLNTGFLSTPFLCSVLSSYGHTDTAYKLLLQDTAPSWLYEVKKGATTIWETWNGIDENHKVSASLNHYSYGAITGWLFGDVAGIKLNYGKITIVPHPNKSIGFASATYDSPLGKIFSKWEYKSNNIIYEIEILVTNGTSSGRTILGSVEKGKLKLEEVYRFENYIKDENGTLVWDIKHLVKEVIKSIAKCREIGKIPQTVAVDTWGVDYVLIDENGKEILPAVSYRDDRTNFVQEEISKLVFQKELYGRTGIQKQNFNTIYQLYCDKKSGKLDNAKYFLMIPDYIANRLTGVMKNEYTNATTTNLVNAKTKTWDYEVIDRLGIKKDIFFEWPQPKPVPPAQSAPALLTINQCIFLQGPGHLSERKTQNLF